MTQAQRTDPRSADDLLERLDRVAACTIALRGLVVPLAKPEFDGLRAQVESLLAAVGRCIAKELGTPDAVGAEGPRTDAVDPSTADGRSPSCAPLRTGPGSPVAR